MPLSMPPLILIVEDEPQLAEVLEAYAQHAGYRTARAADGQAALHAFHTLHPDLILLDQMLPTLTGSEVLRQIRSESSVPVLLLSANPNAAGTQANAFIPKPFRPRDVMAQVRALLE